MKITFMPKTMSSSSSLMTMAFMLLLGLSFNNNMFVSGAEFYAPETLSSGDTGKLDVTLTVDIATTMDGKRTSAVYNNSPMGPTLRVKPGDTLTVTLVNNLPKSTSVDRELYEYVYDEKHEIDDMVNTTIIYNRLDEIGNLFNPKFGYWGTNYVNLHFHGADFDPQMEAVWEYVDGDGGSKTYVFEIPENQQPGTMWYHHHVKGTATYHYLGGLYGFLIIEGDEDSGDILQAPGIKDVAIEVPLMMAEFLPANENTTEPPPMFPIFMNFDWYSVTNGQDSATTTFEFTEGDTVLFRGCSATVEPIIRLSIDDHMVIPVAYDGFQLPSSLVKETDIIAMGGGQRVDFLVRFDTPGTYTIQRHPWYATFFTGVEFCTEAIGAPVEKCMSFDVDRIAGTINVLPKEDGTEVDTSVPLIDTLEIPEYDDYHKALAMQESVDTKLVVFEQKQGFPLFQIPYDGEFVPPGTGFGINGKLQTPYGSIGTVQAGTCETWTVTSVPPGVEHVFHVHNADFMVTHHDGVELETPYWRDSEILLGSNITVHICFDVAKPGDRLLVHCHGSMHLDIGMATSVVVVDADGGTGSGSGMGGGDDSSPAPVCTVAFSLAFSILAMAVGLVTTAF